jgi:hypothetical protein
MRDLKYFKVIAALEGARLIEEGRCPHWTGTLADKDYGPHDESSGILLITDSGGERRCLVPCKHHFHRYINSGTWREI